MTDNGKYAEIHPFYHEMALVAIDGKNGRRYGYINEQGEEIVSPRFWYAQDFKDDTALVGQFNKYYFIDCEGKKLNKNVFRQVEDFEDGMDLAQDFHKYNGISKYGWINRNGEWIIPPDYEEIYPFQEGLATVKKMGGGVI